MYKPNRYLRSCSTIYWLYLLPQIMKLVNQYNSDTTAQDILGVQVLGYSWVKSSFLSNMSYLRELCTITPAILPVTSSSWSLRWLPIVFWFEEYCWFRVNFLNNFYVLELQTVLSYESYYRKSVIFNKNEVTTVAMVTITFQYDPLFCFNLI